MRNAGIRKELAKPGEYDISSQEPPRDAGARRGAEYSPVEVGMNPISRAHAWRASPIVPDLLLGTALVGLDVFMRVVPHAWHFTPLAASALFAAAMFRVRILSLAVPLIALALSDAVMGFYDWRVMAVVYAASALPAAMALGVARLRAPLVLLSLAVASSVVFFLATNFAVWAFDGMYTHDLAGLSACYVAALPFFKNTLAGDLFWTCVLFGTHPLVRMLLASIRGDRASGAAA